MKLFKFFALLCAAAVALVLLNGCVGANMVRGMKALGNDPAIFVGQVTTVYGTAKIVRIGGNRAAQTVTASPDGTVTITNAGATNGPVVVSVTGPVPVSVK